MPSRGSVVPRVDWHLAVVADPAFNAEVEQMLIADMEKSVEMRPGDLDKKSFWFRLGTRLARLTSPIQ